MARHGRKLEDVGQAEAAMDLAIDKIEAAAWLYDQVEIGELGFLVERGGRVPCWISVVSQTGEELGTTLKKLAIEVISSEAQTLREGMRVLHPVIDHEERRTS